VCQSEYDCVKVIREISIMRKLTQIEHNTHTVKLIDLMIPPKETNNGKMGIFIVMDFFQLDIR
jgi:hypothetical protein